MDRIFVCRDRELQQLDGLLAQALGGAGQVCLVTGEAGAGKTSLTTEFARRAEQSHEDLLVAVGDCNSQTGIGDPYLPFREVLNMLAGDIDDRVAQGMTTEENASRLRSFLHVSTRVIKEVGPDLIDIFLPGAGIATRATALVAGKDAPNTELDNGGPAYGGSTDADQGRIFEQMTRVLVSLAQQRPLVLILDDLHWIDSSSASLLFHLARRIEGSRMLVVGTFRPEEISQSSRDSHHPMAQVLPELKRLYGDIVIDLSSGDETEGLAFVEMLLDNEANEFSKAFRRRLYEQTSGQPLFTAELLRHMRDTGALTKNADGNWVEGPDLDWGVLPARTEGAVEKRISRLSDELQEILSVGAVQGQVFTAQVVAQVTNRPERELISALGRDLGRVHRLVSEEGTTRTGTRRVSDFRFRHQLFQKYLYERLGASERQLLHEDVANALENLYGDNADAIAGELAFHFEQSGLAGRAAAYYRQAARRAVKVSAYREAASLARDGIALLDVLPDAAESTGLLLELRLLLGQAQHHSGQFAESMLAFRQAAELAKEVGDAESLARAAIGHSEPGWRYNLIDATMTRLLRDALAVLGDEDSVLRSRVMANLAAAVQYSDSAEDPMQLIERATEIARRLDDPRAIVDCVRLRMHIDREPQRIAERIRLVDEGLQLAHKLDDTVLQMECSAFRVYDLVATGDVRRSSDNVDGLLELAEQYGDPFYIYHAHTMRVAHLILKGEFDQAASLAMSAMQTGQQLGVDHVEGVMGLQMFTIRREQGRLQEVAPVLEHFVKEEGADAAWRPGLTLLYADLGRLDEARQNFDALVQHDFRAIPRDSLRQTCLAYLAETCGALCESAGAASLYEHLLPYSNLALVVGNVTACLGATSRVLGQLASLMKDWETAEKHFEHALSLNEAMDAKPWLAQTRYRYAHMLDSRRHNGDASRAADLYARVRADAAHLGMQKLEQLAGNRLSR